MHTMVQMKRGLSPKKLILLLVILLIVAVGYIGFGLYNEMVQKKQLTTFQQGAQYGYQQAVFQLVQQAQTCQQVPVTAGEATLNMIAVECLQAG